MSVEEQLLCFPREALVQKVPWSSPYHSLVLGLCSTWSFPPPPANNPASPESVSPLLQFFPLAVGKGVWGRSFDVIRESSLLAGRSFRSLFGPHAASFEAKRIICVDFKGHWMCSCKIKFCWRYSSVTPEDLVGQVLQEWSKNTVKI